MARKVTGPVVLVVLDGWGLREEKEHNGVALANTPWYDHLVEKYPFTKLQASGEHVGLPVGQMGNSEVGHTTIGAGCVLYQDLVRITKDAKSGAFSNNPAFVQAFTHVKSKKSQLHVIGMLSTGGVHSHEDHLIEVIKSAKANGVSQVIVHPFLDGRDSPKTAGLNSLRKLEEFVKNTEGCEIGSVIGRYYAMDRDTNWDRTDKAFKAIFHGQAEHIYDTSVLPSQIIQEWYHKEVFDEHLEPMVFKTEQGVLEVKTGDGIIFTNFRKDRAKQLSSKICENKEDKDLCFVTMTHYGKEIEAIVAYKPESIEQTLGGVIAEAGLNQAHLAETEKFPHATYYINGGRQEAYPNEEDILIPSRKDIKTHDEAPEMRAKEICAAAVEHLTKNDFMFINFANPDMVGHTANEKAIITALEVVDRELKKLTEATLKENGALLIIADHGNAEVMVDPVTGEPHTAHTINPVPCILVHNSYHPKLRSDEPGLRDIAPTILDLLGLKKPKSMSGESLAV
jgi:2,3-bisphosphoglycerate-independent phosphoglycerate mutase